jgi:hypothetical protein
MRENAIVKTMKNNLTRLVSFGIIPALRFVESDWPTANWLRLLVDAFFWTAVLSERR